jgi:hypothetical protein
MSLSSPIRIAALLTALLSAPLMASSFEGARTILEQNCIECHGPEKPKGGLALHTHKGFLSGGESDDAFDQDDPKNSQLLRRVRLAHDDEDFMPPLDDEEADRDPLGEKEITLLTNWLSEGAPWPKGVILQARARTEPIQDYQQPDPTLASLAVYPATISLETASDFHRFVAIASYRDGTHRDVSASIHATLADPAIAHLEGTKLTPKADGATTLNLAFRGQTAAIPVTVRDAQKPRGISFQLDVMPIITAAGCNTGSCHGSARGQDGFMLSLFGYDPKGDHFRLTQELPGRRLNLALPEESLLVTKATGQVPHTGGKVIAPGSAFHETLVQWVRDGARFDKPDLALPTRIEIDPKEYVLQGPRVRVPLTVKAYYADGTDRDVTQFSTFSSSNDNSVKINASTGLAKSKNRGEAFLMARFHTYTEGTQAIVIPAELDYQKPTLAENNYIDTHVHAKLHKLRLIPSPLASDEVFLRRVSLDIIGLPPTEAERAAFLADPRPNKRSLLIDELLTRKEFTEMWVMKWAELLQIRTTGGNTNDVTYKAALLWYEWLRDEIASNRPFNEIIHDLLAARGGTFSEPATNYFKLEPDVKKVTENVAQVFMGTRIQCAQCHNHPFDRWTMNDYYGFASFFAQVKRKRAEDPTEQIIFDGGGDIKHPLTKANSTPRFLGETADAEIKGKTRRQAMAEWLTSRDNEWFSRNVVNIMWSHFFGIGITDPVDDVRVSNPASNPELLAALSEKFVADNYDFRAMVRDICNSRTYQLASATNETNKNDRTNFSHALIRRMRAEVLLDTLAQVTETPNKFKGLPRGSRAVQIADGNTSNYFLTTFGRATRKTVCSCEVKMEPNLSQALHLLNGDSTHKRIEQGRVVTNFLKKKKTPDEIITSLYLRTLGRAPTEVERAKLTAALAPATDPKARTEVLNDIFWALLNSKEFIFNH